MRNLLFLLLIALSTLGFGQPDSTATQPYSELRRLVDYQLPTDEELRLHLDALAFQLKAGGYDLDACRAGMELELVHYDPGYGGRPVDLYGFLVHLPEGSHRNGRSLLIAYVKDAKFTSDKRLNIRHIYYGKQVDWSLFRADLTPEEMRMAANGNPRSYMFGFGNFRSRASLILEPLRDGKVKRELFSLPKNRSRSAKMFFTLRLKTNVY